MSFFGKLKNFNSGPPVPPKREENNKGFGWPNDEFDDEDGDMYEAPPCERPAAKVPPRPVEEDVYLDRTSRNAVPQRKAAPPPRLGTSLQTLQHADVFSYDHNSKKPPEIDRNDKPGRNKTMAHPPPARSVPALVPASNSEEDVYLDPNEEQEDTDDVYLEPTEACAPNPRGAMKMPPSPKTAALPSTIPMMKPPVPRVKSSTVLPPLNELTAAPPVEARRAAFPTKFPLPTLSFKPPLPVDLKEARHSLINHPTPGTKPIASFGGMRTTTQSENEDKEWFAGDCSRKTAEDFLQSVNKDGAFLIRHSSAQNSRQPYTLAVLYQEKVYNIPIRFLEETQGYALGKEGKKSEEMFTTLDEMIAHHRNNQLLLIDSKSQAKHTAYLTHPARP